MAVAATRRAILASLALPVAGLTVPAVAASHPDAAILAMGPGIAALIAAVDAVLADPGFDEDDDAFYEADMALLAETRRLASMRASTIDGLIFKARYVERGDDDMLKDSIVADLLAMGGRV